MSKYEDIELVARITQVETNLRTTFETWFSETLQNFNKVAGHIMSAEDLAKLRRERRPDYVYNLFRPFLLRLLGDFKMSMPAVDFLPKTPDDIQHVSVLKGINDYLFYQANDIEYEVSKAFLNALIGRIGWIKQDWVFSDNHPQGIVNIEFYDNFKLKFDPTATRRDLRDCKYISDSTFLSTEELIKIYARNDKELEGLIMEKSIELLGLTQTDKRRNVIITWAERILNWAGVRYSGEKRNFESKIGSEWLDIDSATFKTIDFYERRNIKTMTIYDAATGQTVDVTNFVKKDNVEPTLEKSFSRDWYDNDKLQAIKSKFMYPNIEEQDVEQIYQSSICPAMNVVLYDAPADIQNGNFKYTPIFCFDHHPDTLEMKSIVDDIKDPVRSTNLRRNTMLTYLMRVTHGGWIVEESALREFKDEFIKSMGVPGSVSMVKDGTVTGGKMKEKSIPQFPSALDKYSMEEMELAKFITGVNDNSMGKQESAKESGVLYNARVEQGNIMAEPVNENAQASLQLLAKNNIAYIRRYWKEPQIIRLLENKKQPDWVMINQPTIQGIINDISKGDFDVVISTTPFGRQAKEREFNKLLALNQQVAAINPMYVDLRTLIEASGTTYADKMLNRIQQIDQQQAMMQEQQAMAQQQQAMAEQQGEKKS